MKIDNLDSDDFHKICVLIHNVQNYIIYSDGELGDSELWVLSSYIGGENKMPLEPLNSIFRIWREKGVAHTEATSNEAVGLINKLTNEKIDPYSQEAFKIMFDEGLSLINNLSSTEKYDFVVGIYGLTLHITHSDGRVHAGEIDSSLVIIKYFVDKLNLPSRLVASVDKDFRSSGGDEGFIYK